MQMQRNPGLVMALALALVMLWGAGCSGGKDSGGSDGSGGDGEEVETIDEAALTTIVLEVDYEPGAEPYTGSVGPLGGDTWDLFANNAAALFDPAGVEVVSPSTLSEMGALDELPETDFDAGRILELAEAARSTTASADTLVIQVLWLDGYLESDGERQAAVLGVSIGDTNVLAMFKPVIETLSGSEVVRRFGEQTTLIHEFGHAIGLVNNGVEMQVSHQDAAHGSHCDDDSCVMYWANEGAGDLAEFVLTYVTTGDAVLFKENCRADIAAALE